MPDLTEIPNDGGECPGSPTADPMTVTCVKLAPPCHVQAQRGTWICGLSQWASDSELLAQMVADGWDREHRVIISAIASHGRAGHARVFQPYRPQDVWPGTWRSKIGDVSIPLKSSLILYFNILLEDLLPEAFEWNSAILVRAHLGPLVSNLIHVENPS